jgi:hypothetical protein
MEKNRRSGKLAVILHADVAGSTQLVQQDDGPRHPCLATLLRPFTRSGYRPLYGETAGPMHRAVEYLNFVGDD